MVNEIIDGNAPGWGMSWQVGGAAFWEHSAKELVTNLVKFGLSKDGLPTVAGGQWKYEEFTN